jgi:ribonuclease HI
MAARKLKHFFEEQTITVVSATLLSEIIGCKDATGRVAKWVIELAAHTIQYKPRTTIKSQIIADFFADWEEHQYLPSAPDSTYWRMNFDGSKMLGGLGAGVVFTSPKGDKLQYVLQIHFHASNNVAEYEALVHGLKLAKEIGIQRILYFEDSDLVVHQVSGEWDAKDVNMASYRFYMQQLFGFFEGCEFHHVPRANNDEADRLSKIGSTKQDIPAGGVIGDNLQAIHQAVARIRLHLRAKRPCSGSDTAAGLGGCRLEAEGSSRIAQRGRLDEGLGGYRLQAGPHSRPTR